MSFLLSSVSSTLRTAAFPVARTPDFCKMAGSLFAQKADHRGICPVLCGIPDLRSSTHTQTEGASSPNLSIVPCRVSTQPE